jgi:DNA-binding NarL/FixJ family response regulator
MSDEPLRLLIADDHPAFRAGLRLLLESLDGLDVEVVAEAANGEQALAAALELAPDVIVMFEDGNSVFAALRAGAHGYVLKGAGQEQLARAIQAVAVESRSSARRSPSASSRRSRRRASATVRWSSRSSPSASARSSTSSLGASRIPRSPSSSC